MYIYVIRHGQTEWNINKKMLSFTDIELNETGIKQCQDAKKLIENIDYDLVICSPKKRTKMTMEIVNSKKIPVVFDDRLVERNAGALEGMDTTLLDYRSFWSLGKDGAYECEKVEECKNRVYELLDEIKDKYEDKNILIVTHNGICRLINTYFNGIPKNGNLEKYGQDNCAIKMYEIKKV